MTFDPAFEPVEVEHVRDHAYKSKGPGRRGCAVCGGARNLMDHHGHTQSVNDFLSKDIQVYRGMKDAWGARLAVLLDESGLPRGLARVTVEGEMTFPNRRTRDQGNHRFLIEKALGDALQTGGWLDGDDWDRYEFGGLAYRYEKGVSRTRLVLFPTAKMPDSAGDFAVALPTDPV